MNVKIHYAPDTEGAGGTAKPAADAAKAAEPAKLADGAPAAAALLATNEAGTAAPAAGAAKAAEPAKGPRIDEAALKTAQERAALLAKETPDQKAAREKAETPDQKTAREADEKLVKGARDAAGAALAKSIKMPEGIPVDGPVMKRVIEIAATRDLPAETVQELVDEVAPKLKEAVNAPYELWADTLKKWVADAQADKEFGGHDYLKNLGFVALAIDKLGGAEAPKIREMLGFTGAGNNPEMIRILFRAGKMIAEGQPASGRPHSAEPQSLAEGLYPEMAKTQR